MLFLLKMPLQTEAFVQLEQDPQVADEPQLALMSASESAQTFETSLVQLLKRLQKILLGSQQEASLALTRRTLVQFPS